MPGPTRLGRSLTSRVSFEDPVDANGLLFAG
jgi:hypothetical protein